jgi:hypothetical protein
LKPHRALWTGKKTSSKSTTQNNHIEIPLLTFHPRARPSNHNAL